MLALADEQPAGNKAVDRGHGARELVGHRANHGDMGEVGPELERNGKDNDSLAGLIVTFFIGICLEQNLGPDRARITKKIDAIMQLIRGKG